MIFLNVPIKNKLWQEYIKFMIVIFNVQQFYG